MGVLTTEAPIADYLPWVSPATQRELRALMASGKRRAAEAATRVDVKYADHARKTACRDLKVSLEPNHLDPKTGTLVTQRMLPPYSGARYEFKERLIYKYGLVGLGRTIERSVRVDPATWRPCTR